LLRIYISGISYDKAGKILEDAEELSGEVCELCGKKAKLSSKNGWYQTRCNNHNK